ncbi:phosphatidate cytidylyltransferase [Candidatus Ichthyocystis hellenicum]|uniref:Phosphatidate cytidylyltransferase n=3 Tax=Burkholderiales genera incertae sedis TaxID=224471 RepID=A0A0S4LZP9_9BURK|nr:phosphatidate cytidylyltransferase [Candidatus Ichthyocystis hellenicum]
MELMLRFLTSVSLIVVLLLALRYFSLLAVVVFVGVFFALSCWEWGNFFVSLTRMKLFINAMIPTSLLLYGILAWYFPKSQAREVAFVFSGFWALAPFGLLGYDSGRWRLTWAVYFLGMVCILSGWLSVLWIFKFFGAKFLLWAIVIVMVMDSCAYLVGKSCGRTILAPLISPGKSFEGLCGAYFSAVVVLIFSDFMKLGIFRHATLGLYFFVAAIFVLYAVTGDLVESSVKRVVGCKDSGKLLPGHGGVLDRFDSYFSVMPLVFCLLTCSP